MIFGSRSKTRNGNSGSNVSTERLKYELLPEKSISFRYNMRTIVSNMLEKPNNLEQLYKSFQKDIEDEEYTVTAYRIRALKNIPFHNVKAGDLGGYISHDGILSHKGNSWIADEAIVIGSTSFIASRNRRANVQVGGNAIVKGRSRIISRHTSFVDTVIDADAVIDGSSTIFVGDTFDTLFIKGYVGGANVIVNPDVLEGLVSGDNMIFSSATLKSGTAITGRNIIGPNFSLTGKARVVGDVRIGRKAYIQDSAIIQDNVRLGNDNYHSWSVVLSGNAIFGDNCRTSRTVKVGGNAVIGDDVQIGDSVTIQDNVQVKEGTILNGTASLVGDKVIGVPKDNLIITTADGNQIPYNVAEMNFDDSIRIAPNASNPALSSNVPVVSSNAPAVSSSTPFVPSAAPVASSKIPSPILKKHAQIVEEIASYESDIVKILKYPVFTDSTNETTLDMIIAMRDVDNISPDESPEDYIEAVKTLERAFLRAEANARRIATTSLDDDQSKKLSSAKTMFSMVVNEASSETEKKNAFKQGMKSLEGIVVVPDKAVDSLRQRSGLLELEA